MKRTAVNPWQWSLGFGFNQAELVEGAQKVLFCSGQTSVDGDGNVMHEGDMAAQIALALDNVEAVLAGAGMSLTDVVRANVYTTDVDAFLANSAPFDERLGAVGAVPASTLLGVSRLAFSGLMLEIEVTAVA